MSTSETDRLHLYEIARERWQDNDAARTLMNLLPPDPDRLATKDDLALTTAVLRTEIERQGKEMSDRMTTQTRTLLLANIVMWLSIAGVVTGLR